MHPNERRGTYLPTHLPTYLPYLPTCLPTYLSTYESSSPPNFLTFLLPFFFSSFLPNLIPPGPGFTLPPYPPPGTSRGWFLGAGSPRKLLVRCQFSHNMLTPRRTKGRSKNYPKCIPKSIPKCSMAEKTEIMKRSWENNLPKPHKQCSCVRSANLYKSARFKITVKKCKQIIKIMLKLIPMLY